TKVWWTDTCGHSWCKSPLHMTKIQDFSCPTCKSVAKLHPELLSEWHDKLDPNTVSAGSRKQVTWQCNKNTQHTWKTAIYTRTIQKQGYPYCSRRRVLKGENDILTTHAHLQDAWADHRNIDEFSFGSNYKATWKCTQDENHTWTAIIDDVS